MKYILILCSLFTTCVMAQQRTHQGNPKALQSIITAYDSAFLQLYPTNAMARGDNSNNDKLYMEFTDSFRTAAHELYSGYLTRLKAISPSNLSAAEKIDYDVLLRDLTIRMEGLRQPTYLMPADSKNGLYIFFPVLGSGTGLQPFKTTKDYENWLARASRFSAYIDSTIVYFRKGMTQGMVLPKALVEKMIPQAASQISTTPEKSSFWGPIKSLPQSFAPADRERFTAAFTTLINGTLNPAYQRLRDFLQNEYLPAARSTSGVGALKGGKALYEHRIRLFTTTDMSADAVFNLGLKEVARIGKEMEKVKRSVGYKGDLKSFFEYMRNDPKFYPYNTQEEILDYYRSITPRITPALSRMFNNTPKTPFEVRAVEAFRAATTAANYVQGSLSSNRPGIFYVPIVDPKKTQARESLFLHEAIPGHHYQISLARENTSLSDYRRNSGNSAYSEGWALYTESLGKELGMYTDPYQYMFALADEMHRAIRLVVDAGIHTKGWSREKAIQYSLDNEPIELQRAESEIERYMANPGQALSYKIGELKIKELRARYTKMLGDKFNLALFHDAILMDGALPLGVLERKMDAWAAAQLK